MPKRATFKEAGVVFPEITDGYPGVTQTGWATYEQEKIDENTQILEFLTGHFLYTPPMTKPLSQLWEYLSMQTEIR